MKDPTATDHPLKLHGFLGERKIGLNLPRGRSLFRGGGMRLKKRFWSSQWSAWVPRRAGGGLYKKVRARLSEKMPAGIQENSGNMLGCVRPRVREVLGRVERPRRQRRPVRVRDDLDFLSPAQGAHALRHSRWGLHSRLRRGWSGLSPPMKTRTSSGT
jgi:hypothetical protein